MQFANWEFFFQHYNFNACKPSCSRFFFGVGGRGRRPLNPPTPRHEGAGVRVNKEKTVRGKIV